MAYGKVEQRCPPCKSDKPWQKKGRSKYARWIKIAKHKVERRRVKADIECGPQYNRYGGYEI